MNALLPSFSRKEIRFADLTVEEIREMKQHMIARRKIYDCFRNHLDRALEIDRYSDLESDDDLSENPEESFPTRQSKARLYRGICRIVDEQRREIGSKIAKKDIESLAPKLAANGWKTDELHKLEQSGDLFTYVLTRQAVDHGALNVFKCINPFDLQNQFHERVGADLPLRKLIDVHERKCGAIARLLSNELRARKEIEGH